uniref:Uncharacterized protein n=1 Tax=Utricularia reniformis TaxID=192314 RepID=A0A1Y0B056_9LAMI|nr:hypothetical protein AEK19_MT0541 [Utricularia reniformis]ART30797.1 hypothetical protein AEK19_MT0541 [Utricularia reniformis]
MTDALTRLRYTLSYPLTSSSSFTSLPIVSSLSTLNVRTLLSFSRRVPYQTYFYFVKAREGISCR